MARGQEILAALTGGSAGLDIPGVSGVARGPTWDATMSVQAPELPGDSVVFVALEDGTLVVEADLPDGALTPLADAFEENLPPPYRAAAVRASEDIWSGVAESVAIVEIALDAGDEIDLSVVGGVRELKVNGTPSSAAVPELDALAEEHEDVSLHAERVDGSRFAVDVFPL